ncbi:glycosyltransferase family 2 protein [Chitinophagaceae bacterium 26-R-25]|nr:glycosyltransferase family 2 protein [Chitinophagaceae bacterium 26-R-25]
MLFLQILFWICLFIVFYAYVGYGFLIAFLVAIKKLFTSSRKAEQNFQPTVALIIAAYNEEDFILHKLQNTKELDYPADKLHVIFITDGSTDKTPELIKTNSNFELLHSPERKGKAFAMNRAVQFAKADILVFSDANTLLNKECVAELVKHYASPKVGGVAGEKKIIKQTDDKASAAGEGLYWKYESALKRLDSSLNTIVGAAGELFSVRRELYEPVMEGTIIEDFVLSLRICMKGYLFKYEPKAFAIETASSSMKEEQKRKVRICAGGFQAMQMLKDLLNIFKYRLLTFQYISHRVLRWAVCPLCLVIMFFANLLIVILSPMLLYKVIMVAQIVFYTLSFIGWQFANRNIKIKSLYVPYYFVFMNAAAFMGFNRFLKGNQSVIWEKAGRQKLA